MRFELMTSSLPRRRSTPELRGRGPRVPLIIGAGDETRTRDPQLGRLMLYQLSYTRPRIFGLRISDCGFDDSAANCTKFEIRNPKSAIPHGAGGRIRTSVGREPAGFTARCH